MSAEIALGCFFMRIGIDASNIRSGGGLTHLVELLANASPADHGISNVVVWGSQVTLDVIHDRPWLLKCHDPLLDGGIFRRLFWQYFRFWRLAKFNDCGLVFVPGGLYLGKFRPYVTLSQNLLPFEKSELHRYKFNLIVIRLIVLKFLQLLTFRNADGLIFLSQYAKNIISPAFGRKNVNTVIIPHGIEDRFFCEPRNQLPIGDYSFRRPFRVLYVSIIDNYKHQWHVSEAIAMIRKLGIPIALDLVGPAYPPALEHLRSVLKRVDPTNEFIHYSGVESYWALHRRYAQADLFLFASSCENLPNILLEAMASGLPIACSNRGPMPEVLGDAGVYFDPEDPESIVEAISCLADDVAKRKKSAEMAYDIAREFTWQRCANETFNFIAEVFGESIHGDV